MKTFLAASCAAVFAGGMVYFTTTPVTTNGSAVIKNEAAADEGAGSKDIISRYIGSDEGDVERTAALDIEEAENPYELEGDTESHPHPVETMDSDEEGEDVFEGSAEVESEDLDFENLDMDVRNETDIEADSEDPVIVTKTVTETITVTETTEPPLEVTESGIPFEGPVLPSEIVEIEPEEIVPNAPDSHEDNPIIATPYTRNDGMDPAQKRIRVVFEQAEKIDVPDLRDRAYLDLVDYATAKGLFDEAQFAALKIQQVELRDTARERIAMGMARYGMSDEAFALMEQIEVEELRDVMRLRVIEALLGTERR